MGDVDQQPTGQPEGVEEMADGERRGFRLAAEAAAGPGQPAGGNPAYRRFQLLPLPDRDVGRSAFPAPTCCASWPASTGWTPRT